MIGSARPFAVGLTGGIGAGKSTVAELFAELGVEVIDADVIARELVATGTPLLAALIDAFGSDVLGGDGGLDRRRLRERVFRAPHERQRLERLLHPAIRAELKRRAARVRGPYALVVVPLLLEGGGYPWIDRVLVIDAPTERCIERVTRRDGSDRTLVRSIMNSQLDRCERLDRADEVLVNDADRESLRVRVCGLHQQYLKCAATGRLQPTVNECDHQ